MTAEIPSGITQANRIVTVFFTDVAPD